MPPKEVLEGVCRDMCKFGFWAIRNKIKAKLASSRGEFRWVSKFSDGMFLKASSL